MRSLREILDCSYVLGSTNHEESDSKTVRVEIHNSFSDYYDRPAYIQEKDYQIYVSVSGRDVKGCPVLDDKHVEGEDKFTPIGVCIKEFV